MTNVIDVWVYGSGMPPKWVTDATVFHNCVEDTIQFSNHKVALKGDIIIKLKKDKSCEVSYV